MRMNRRNSPAWTQVRGEIAPWTARFDVFVKHRSPSKHNSYRHFAAQCSESESVYATRSTKNVQALIFWDKKRTAIVLLSFRRRYFTMGIVKIYNVLGGFYKNYITMVVDISVHKLAKICENILCKMRKRLTSSAS